MKGKRPFSLWVLGIGVLLVMIIAISGCTTTTTVTATATATATTTTTQTATVKPIKLVFTEFEPAGSYWETDIGRPYFAELEKRTGGKVQVEQHYGGDLVGLFDVYDYVLKGTVDIAKVLPTMFADKFPVSGVITFQPVNIKAYRGGQVWLDLYNNFPEMRAEYDNSPLVGFLPMPSNGFGTTSKVITKWEDCKGLKVPGPGPAPEMRIKAVGMVPISIPPPDCYMGFKTGTLDGVSCALMSLKDSGWGDVLPTVTMVNVNGGAWAYVMNKDTWNSLPADIQGIIKDMIPWLTELDDKVQYQNDQKALSTFPDEFGTEFTWLTQEELDRWAAVDTPTLDAFLSQYVPDIADELKAEFLRLHEKYAAPEYAFE
jgi:TRAP-type C4-dicarboxylate transport system substrate-binding protein